MIRIKYTKELLENAVKDAYSFAQVCRNVGLKPTGSNTQTVKKKLFEFNVDVSHFKGQKWNLGLKNTNKAARFELSDILQKGISYSSNSLKDRLIKEGIKENKCEKCNTPGEEVKLELHHINGDHYDNRLENLQILCPNCHSKTPNYRGRNTNKNTNEVIKLSEKYKKDHTCICMNCGKEFYSDRTDRTRKFCSRKCYNSYVKSISNLQEGIREVLTKEEIEKEIPNHKNITSLANALNCSRTTIRNKLIEFGLYDDFKFKYDFHSKQVGQYNFDGNLIKIWPSIIDAESTLHISDIGKCISGKRRSAGGFLWKEIKN